MNLYLDSAYIAKCYINEPDAPRVRHLVREADRLHSSAWCLAELACIFHRHVREQLLTAAQANQLRNALRADVEDGVWTLLPVSEALLRHIDLALQKLPPEVFLRAGDAVHLISARDAGFSEI